MFFTRWRILESLEKVNVKISKFALTLSLILLIVGPLSLGYGLASFAVADYALGFTLSIIGGTMLFAGIIMTLQTFAQIADALGKSVNAAMKITDAIEDVEKKTFGSEESKYHSGSSLQKQVDKLQKDVKYLAGVLKSKGFNIVGMWPW